MFKNILSILALAVVFLSQNLAVHAQNTAENQTPNISTGTEKLEVKEPRNNFAGMADEVFVSGEQKGDHFYFSNKTNLNSDFNHAGSLAVWSTEVNINSGAVIKNNLYLGAKNAVLDGVKIENGAFIFATNLTIKNSSFAENVKIYATNLTIENSTFNKELAYSAKNFVNQNNNFAGGIFENKALQPNPADYEGSFEKVMKMGSIMAHFAKFWFFDLWVLLALIVLAIFLNKKKKLHNPRINFDTNYVQDIMIGVTALLGFVIVSGILSFISAGVLFAPLIAMQWIIALLLFLAQPYTYIYIANLFKNSIFKSQNFNLILVLTAFVAWILFNSHWLAWILMFVFFVLPAFGKLMRNLYFACKEYISK